MIHPGLFPPLLKESCDISKWHFAQKDFINLFSSWWENTTDVGNETKITHQRFSVILFSLIHWETRPNKPPALNADNILPIPLNADSGLSMDPIQQTALSGAASTSDGLDLWLPNGFSEFPSHCDLVNKIIVLVKEIWFREWNHCKLHFCWWTIGGKDYKLKFSFPIQLIRIITIMWI